MQIGDQGPISNVWKLLNSTAEEDTSVPVLYCEMLYLSSSSMDQFQNKFFDEDGSVLNWKQAARWLKNEQEVEGEGTRFSKPHVTFMSLQSLLQIRNSLKKGLVLLDQEPTTSLPELFDLIQRTWMDRGILFEEKAPLIRTILNSAKLHLVHGRLRRADEIAAAAGRTTRKAILLIRQTSLTQKTSRR